MKAAQKPHQKKAGVSPDDSEQIHGNLFKTQMIIRDRRLSGHVYLTSYKTFARERKRVTFPEPLKTQK